MEDDEEVIQIIARNMYMFVDEKQFINQLVANLHEKNLSHIHKQENPMKIKLRMMI